MSVANATAQVGNALLSIPGFLAGVGPSPVPPMFGPHPGPILAMGSVATALPALALELAPAIKTVYRQMHGALRRPYLKSIGRAEYNAQRRLEQVQRDEEAREGAQVGFEEPAARDESFENSVEFVGSDETFGPRGESMEDPHFQVEYAESGVAEKPPSDESALASLRPSVGKSAGPDRPGGKKGKAKAKAVAPVAKVAEALRKVEAKLVTQERKLAHSVMGKTAARAARKSNAGPVAPVRGAAPNMPRSSAFNRVEKVDRRGDSAIVSGSDFLATIEITAENNVVGGILHEYFFNPVQANTQSLNQFSHLYQKFEFLELELVYDSALPFTAGGSINMLFDADPADIDYTGKSLVRQAVTTKSAHQTPVMRSTVWRWDAKRENPGVYYCDDLGEIHGGEGKAEQRFTEQGHSIAHVVVPISGLTLPAHVGTLTVRYKVKFYHRMVVDPYLTASYQGVKYWVWDSTDLFASDRGHKSPHWDSFVTKEALVSGGKVADAAFEYALWLRPGLYLVAIVVEANITCLTMSTTTLAFVGYTDSTASSHYIGEGAFKVANPSASSVTASIMCSAATVVIPVGDGAQKIGVQLSNDVVGKLTAGDANGHSITFNVIPVRDDSDASFLGKRRGPAVPFKGVAVPKPIAMKQDEDLLLRIARLESQLKANVLMVDDGAFAVGDPRAASKQELQTGAGGPPPIQVAASRGRAAEPTVVTPSRSASATRQSTAQTPR